MSKPLGIGFSVSRDGPRLHVTGMGRAESLVWDAVEEAQLAGWTPAQFINEVRDAWAESRKRAIADELKQLR